MLILWVVFLVSLNFWVMLLSRGCVGVRSLMVVVEECGCDCRFLG